MTYGPELDYAFIAEHAQVASGRLNVMGGSFTHLVVESLPSIHSIAVAGRIRASKDTGPVEVSVTFTSPAGETQYAIEGSIELEPGPDTRPYGDRIGLLFASNLQALLPAEGLYEVRVHVAGSEARRLAFSVETRADGDR